jgi:iron complex outermembrane receptor protein
MARLRFPSALHPFYRTARWLALLLGGCAAVAAQGEEAAVDVTQLSLEQLMDVEVYSVSKQNESLARSPAAVFVVSQEDIRRSGATTIPEALRMVPGLQVARVDRNQWAISARGFNGAFFANKLQVLIDGRSVYTPLFSGVWWDSQDTLLEDIERIEVIRGPGASLWGANAVNGTINIISKKAKDTQGGLLSAQAGMEEHGTVGLRYGGRLNEDTHYRVYGKYYDRDDFMDAQGHNAGDTGRSGRGGFRIDSRLNAVDDLTVQGDVHQTTANTAPTADFSYTPLPSQFLRPASEKINGENLLTRWQHRYSPTSVAKLQLYWDRTERNGLLLDFREAINTFDADFQHDWQWSDSHRLVWGLGYRYLHRNSNGGDKITLNPSQRSDELLSGFIQDDITLLPDTLQLILGSKFEHKNTVGLQVQPTGRLLWTPDQQNSVWASVSRAMRMPSWIEQDARYNMSLLPPAPGSLPLPTLLQLQGNRQVESEEVLAYELGYRSQLSRSLSFDAALFYNDYRNLVSNDLGACAFEPALGLIQCPVLTRNRMYGESYGVELAGNWYPRDDWRLQAGYTLTHIDLRHRDGYNAFAIRSENSDPQQQTFLRSSLDLPHHVTFDLMFRYVDASPALRVKAYPTLDLRLAWRPVRDVELSVTGRNLADDMHFEAGNQVGIAATQVQRDVLFGLRWSF